MTGRSRNTPHPPGRQTPKSAARGRRTPGAPAGRAAGGDAETAGWIWGRHAGLAALANPDRRVHHALVTRNAARSLGIDLSADTRLTLAEPAALDAALPPGAVHQGLAIRAEPLVPAPLDALAEPQAGVLLLLDQVTDPHNVGAILRTALAFDARGVILQDRKAPPFMGACAKAAVGAAEKIAHARVVNLSRALHHLREAGWRSVALTGDAETPVEDALGDATNPAGPAADGVVLVLGAEDKGVRPSVAAACDVAARIPINPAVESLNVSIAAAVALYAARRRGAALND